MNEHRSIWKYTDIKIRFISVHAQNKYKTL